MYNGGTEKFLPQSRKYSKERFCYLVKWHENFSAAPHTYVTFFNRLKNVSYLRQLLIIYLMAKRK